MIAARGLGATWKLESDGTWVDCDLWSNVFNSICWNPLNAELAGPNASNPTAPASPMISMMLGSKPGTGPFSFSDYISAYLGDPSNLLWVGIAAIAGILLIRRL